MIARSGLALGALAMIWPALTDTQSAMARIGSAVPGGLSFGVLARDRTWQNEALFDDANAVAASAPAIRNAALASLLSDPLDAMALRQVAYTSGPAGVPVLRLAERVSRRDLLAQIALIEVEVAAGRTDRILQHYDRALTVFPEMAGSLFPILARAANEPGVGPALAGFAGRPWFRSFLAGALSQGASPQTVAMLWQRAEPGLDVEGRLALRRQLLGALVARGAFAEAAQMATGGSAAGAAVLGDPGFTPASLDAALGQLGWELGLGAAVRTSAADGGQIEAEIAAGRSGLVAERVTVLPAGGFARRLVVAAGAGGSSARIGVDVRCLGARGEVGAVVLSEMLVPGGAGSVLAFAVPAGCAAQRWRIMGYGDLGGSAVRVRLGWAGAADVGPGRSTK